MVMSLIESLTRIKNAVYGREVREAIHDGVFRANQVADNAVSTTNQTQIRQDNLEAYNDQMIQEMTDKDVISAPEIIQARGGKPTLQARLDETTALLAQTTTKMDSLFISVKHPPLPMIGAKCDGVTDDSPVINTIANYVSASGGGSLYFPLGTTICNILLPTKVSIYGKGIGLSILKSAPLSNKDVIKSIDFDVMTERKTATLPTEGIRFNQIEDITIDGNHANNSKGYGIRIFGSFIRFKNIYVQNCRDSGIWTEFSRQTSIIVDGRDDMTVNMLESLFENIKINGCDGNGWDFCGPHDSKIIGLDICRIKGWGFNLPQNYHNLGVTGYRFNIFLVGNGLKMNKTFNCYDLALDNNESGIGLEMHYVSPSDCSTLCRLYGLKITGFATGAILSGTNNIIEGFVNNCGNDGVSSAIKLHNLNSSIVRLNGSACDNLFNLVNSNNNHYTLNFVGNATTVVKTGEFGVYDYVRVQIPNYPPANISQDIDYEMYVQSRTYKLPDMAGNSTATILTDKVLPTTATRGGVLQQSGFASLVANPTMNDFNTLLDKLRGAGIISF